MSKHAVLKTDLGRNLPKVRGYPAQLRQLVMNLVTNASVALGERDGVIQISTKCVSPSDAARSGANGKLSADDYVQLEVSDTGQGVTPQTRSCIFDSSRRSSQGAESVSLWSQIVLTHEGAIQVESEPPGASSREVWEEARRLRPDLQVILISAYARETVEATFPGIEAAMFIRKPFAIERACYVCSGNRNPPSPKPKSTASIFERTRIQHGSDEAF
jgi:signal transduction histidine kinase